MQARLDATMLPVSLRAASPVPTVRYLTHSFGESIQRERLLKGQIAHEYTAIANNRIDELSSDQPLDTGIGRSMPAGAVR